MIDKADHIRISYSIFHKSTEVARAYFSQTGNTVRCTISTLVLVDGQRATTKDFTYDAREISLGDDVNEIQFIRSKLNEFYGEDLKSISVNIHQLTSDRPSEGIQITRDYSSKKTLVNFLDKKQPQVFEIDTPMKEILKKLDNESI